MTKHHLLSIQLAQQGLWLSQDTVSKTQTFTIRLKTGRCWVLVVLIFNYRACYDEIFMRLPAFAACQRELSPFTPLEKLAHYKPIKWKQRIKHQWFARALVTAFSSPLFIATRTAERCTRKGKIKESFQQETKMNHFRINIIPQPWRAIKLILLVKRRA